MISYLGQLFKLLRNGQSAVSCLGIASAIALSPLVGAAPTLAQVTSDSTVGTNVNQVGSVFEIDNGNQQGTNLFHSFSQFSLNAGESAAFINLPVGIENILARVTGGLPSNINGQIQVVGTANLFLINPSGIIFGSNASLDVQGSFIATTANAVKFADGNQFSATSPAAPILTSSIPSSLVFSGSAAPIINRSQDNTFQNSVPSPAGLRVPDGQTLALVGGDVSLEQGNLTADGGRIELGSVAGSGSVGLTQVTRGWALNYSGIQTPNAAGRLFGNIQMSQESVVDASDINSLFGGGEIQVRGDRITLNNALIASTTYGSQAGGNIDVTASSLELKGTLFNGYFSGIFSQTGGTGTAGNITINTGQLIVLDQASLSTSTFGDGRSGDLTVNASQLVEVSGASSDSLFASGLFTSPAGNGDGGKLTINTRQLMVRDGAQVNASTFSTGKAGDILIRAADSVEVSRKAGIFAAPNKKAVTGVAPNITIETSQLLLQDMALISTVGTSGNGGNITIQAQNIQMRRGSQIKTDAVGSATGGNITINTATLVALENSDITANSVASFGGRVIVNAQAIFGTKFRSQLTPESDITASSDLGPLFSGQVILNTPDLDPLRGVNEQQRLSNGERVAQGCAAQGGQASKSNSFVNTGTGGLPANPSAPFSSIAVWEDMRSHSSSQTSNSAASGVIPSKTSPPTPIVEAQGWVLKPGSKDTVILTVNAPQVTPDTVSQTTFCNGNRS